MGVMDYLPLIIIGAARSGTNILRDTLTRARGWETWPCDEINAIWRHGNLDRESDVLSAGDARPEVARFIRGAFDRMAGRTGADVIVEKTCASSLRIAFIDSIFPDARYLFIVRDGRDAAISASKRWTASIEPLYLLRKLRYVPLRDVAHYSGRFIANRRYRIGSVDSRLKSWGPRFSGMEDWITRFPLIEICARQWAECVDEADRALAAIAPERVARIRYEDFVSDPRGHLAGVEDLVGRPIVTELPPTALDQIHATSVGSWRNQRSVLTKRAMQIMEPTLVRNRYDIAG
jgi:hypothetical protein